MCLYVCDDMNDDITLSCMAFRLFLFFSIQEQVICNCNVSRLLKKKKILQLTVNVAI